jgi:flavin-dependent dehydrogenase
VPLRAIVSAWGSPDLAERHAMTHPLGEGRHVDRASFDAALAAWAQAQGVVVRRDTGTCAVKREGHVFCVKPSHGAEIVARAFIDASGRGAPAGATLERRWLAIDRQVAIVGRARGGPAASGELLLEAASEGYWYSAPQPDGALVVALATDADLALARGRAGLLARFEASLAQTSHTARRCEGRAFEGAPRVVRADSGRLIGDSGPGWCAVGDAAVATDPLTGSGVARALRSAAEGAERIEAMLAGAGKEASANDRRFGAYLDRRGAYYALETRWPRSLFWTRRRPVAWRETAITLAPTALLRGTAEAPASALARAEALAPPRILASTIGALRLTPRPAHAVLESLRASAPLGDTRLLVALQLLIEDGALTLA